MISVSDLKPLLLNPDLSEARFIKAIHQLSAGFTVSRDHMGKYGEDDDLVSAYTLLYLPTNMPKLNFVLNQLDEKTLTNLSNAHFIDFGCGPGTYSLAWANQIKTNEITLVDYTKGMREQSKKILQHFHPSIKLHVEEKITKRPDGKVVLFFGHALNELSENEAKNIIEKIDPDFVFFIEPGTSDFFVKAKNIRTHLIEKGMSIAYPCPSTKVCPNDWCHQVWRGTHDPEIERLCQIVKLDRRTQPMISHLYTKEKVSNQRATFTRFLGETKFSFEWEACLSSGELRHVQWQKRNLSKSEIKSMDKSNVGIRFDFEIEKELNDGVLRIKKASG